MVIDKLFGEIEPGVFEFRIGARNHNPFAAHWYSRYLQIERLTEDQLKALQAYELRAGQVCQPFAIKDLLSLPPLPPQEEDRIKAVKQYLIENMIDENDRRCIEARGCEAFSWFDRYPHLTRRFGMLHAMDWQVLREKLPEVLPAMRVVSEIDAVERRYASG